MINHEGNPLSFYEQDIKDYLNLDEETKEIIKNFALYYPGDFIKVQARKSKFFEKIQELYINKKNIDLFNDNFFIYPDISGYKNIGYIFRLGDYVDDYIIRIINIRIFLTVKPEQEELNRILIKVSQKEEESKNKRGRL